MTDAEQRLFDDLKSRLDPVEAELRANGGKPSPEMQECLDLFKTNNEELAKLIEKKTACGDKMYIGQMGFKMDEEIFAKMQEVQTGFSPDIWHTPTEYKRLYAKLHGGKEEQLPVNESVMLLFMKMFGCHGEVKDLDAALDIALNGLDYLPAQKPRGDNNREDSLYMGWLNAIGSLSVLIGTIYAYKNEPIKSCYYLMQGLKTEMVAMSTPYCDFIKYMFSKLDDRLKIEDIREGIGYSADNPCGSVDVFKRMLVSWRAMEIIPDFVGNNGDMLMCHNGSSGLYGHLTRLGSTHGESIPECVDIYETWLIDKEFNLKRIQFFWNGYFENGITGKVLLPIGFRIKKQSKLLGRFEFVKNKSNIECDDHLYY
ncbi:MAG: hypothetical protein LBT20_07425 [Clostridiales bacterium]|jgi:hypothetical protein|nr:hypothetical protein [Clostridiales bacterium]